MIERGPAPLASRFRPDIQGLRAIAVIAVVAYHAGVPALAGGYLGVDVFFVISGYLIGGRLVRSLNTSGRIDLLAFYARRARRILPAALVVIVMTVIASLFVASPVRLPDIAIDAAWSTFSAANIRFAIQQTDYLTGTAPSPFQHFWSLGVEEQFYLVVPLLLVAMYVVLRRSAPRLVVTGIVLVVASFAVCVALGDTPWNFFMLSSRAWELGVGVLAAVAAPRLASLSRPVANVVGFAGLVVVIGAIALGGIPGYPHPGLGTALPVLGTALLLANDATDQGRQTWSARLLGVRPAVFVGTLSYSLYLVHWPLLALAGEQVDHLTPTPVWEVVVLLLVAVVAAWLLHTLVERPFLSRSRDSTWRPPRSVVAGITASLLLGIVLLEVTPALAALPLTSARSVSDAPATVDPRGTPFVPRNVTPDLARAVDDTGELYTNGCQTSRASSQLNVCSFGPDGAAVVVLFGDSHAGRWFPALRSAFAGKPVRLVSIVKSGCRSIESADAWAGARTASCGTWRVAATSWIAAHPPALLVLASHIGPPTTDRATFESDWAAATASTIARFPDPSRVAVIGETPQFQVSGPICLARHLDDADACGEPRARAVNEAAILAVGRAAIGAGAHLVDFDDYFCNTSSCPAVIGPHLVYSDEHHITATFSATLGDAVYARLSGLIGAG